MKVEIIKLDAENSRAIVKLILKSCTVQCDVLLDSFIRTKQVGLDTVIVGTNWRVRKLCVALSNISSGNNWPGQNGIRRAINKVLTEIDV